MASVKKILICPDSFKGTISSVEASEILAEAVLSTMPLAKTYMVPIADGGEGTLECFRRAVAGSIISVQTRNSNFKPISGEYYLTPEFAIIESAKVIGLPQTEDKNPSRTTSYGVGQLISDAARRNGNVILTLGGSSTNDGGCGIAAALGVKFFDGQGKPFIPTGATLCNIDKIDTAEVQKDFNLTCMCDVVNPLYGENGAAYVFAPQKGATYSMAKKLDEGLKHLAEVIKRDLHIDVSNLSGGGAAGGIAAGMVAFFGAKLKSGIEIMLEAVHFDELLADSKLVVTGEGRLDSQSFSGKAIDGIVRHSAARGVPVIAICGQIEIGFDLKNSGLALAIACSHDGDKIINGHDYRADLKTTALNLFKKLS